ELYIIICLTKQKKEEEAKDMSKITAELIQQSNQIINPLRERHLDLKGLKIYVIENLGATLDFFDCIDMSDNEIKKLGNFSILLRLKTLILNNNKISKLSRINEALPNLENLCLMNNRITELKEIDSLSGCQKLQRLVLYNNVVTQAPDFRLYVISRIPSLRMLDFQKVTKQEREQAQAKFEFQPQLNKIEDQETKLAKDKKEKLRYLIENAQTAEEINRIELLLKSSELKNQQLLEQTLQQFK
ncbi:small nuclear ribonucleoprotein polypeptide a, putative, partial [Ichthyophthirius multifiliis]